MEVDWLIRTVILVVLLLLSAFFSGSEVALFSLDKKKLKEYNSGNGIVVKYILNLLEYPRRLLVTILLGNTIVNVAASIIAVTIALDLAVLLSLSVDFVLFMQIVALTVLILLFGEITPKVWAAKYPLKFAKIVSIPLYWISVLIYPVAKILTDLIKFFASKLKYDKSKTAILSSELPELANLGIEKGTLEEEEHELIHGLVSFKTVVAREVMTPRVDITAISIDTSFEEALNIISESGHSRIPLYENSLDNVIGIIYAKDLLPFMVDRDKEFSLKKISREVLYIPETKLISELMQEFQSKNMHAGIVVDEYGGTSGIISLEDILEEIVGEIRDEYDKDEPEITKLEENKYIVLGKVDIDELNELLSTELGNEDDDYDTVGGFIFNQAGTIPDIGFNFIYKNFKFTVLEVENNRINKVQIDVIESEEEKGK